MKKISRLLTLTLPLFLIGCSNTVDNSNKEVSSTKAKTSSIKEKKDNREVTNGELLKVGQWTSDSDIGKLTLYKIWGPNTEITDGPLVATIDSIKIFKIEPQNSNQIEYAKNIFNTNSVSNPYYEIQVSYNLKNTSNQEVGFNGIRSIVTTTGQQFSPDSGLNDTGLGTQISANANKDFFAIGMLKDGDFSKIKDISITLDSVYNIESYDNISDGSEPLKILLDN